MIALSFRADFRVNAESGYIAFEFVFAGEGTMGRLIAGAFLVSAIALAGMTGAFAQASSTGSGSTNSGTGIGKLNPQGSSGGSTNSGTGIGKLNPRIPVPPPPPPPPGGATTDSGTGIGKLHALSAETAEAVRSGTVVWTDHKRLRFFLRRGGAGHVFHVRHRTAFHVGRHRVGFYALHRGQHARVAYHWSHHRRIADDVRIRRH